MIEELANKAIASLAVCASSVAGALLAEITQPYILDPQTTHVPLIYVGGMLGFSIAAAWFLKGMADDIKTTKETVDELKQTMQSRPCIAGTEECPATHKKPEPKK